jgi:rod shape-determining protein MreB
LRESSGGGATVAGGVASELAIDFGTANTVVYARERGIVSHEPSVMAMHKRHNGTPVVLGFGQVAKEMIGKTPEHIRTVRPVRDGVVANSDLAWLMLKHIIRQASRPRVGRHLRVILGVPPSSSAMERRAIVESAEAAGANEVYLVDEPIAAALGAGLDIREPYGHMLVDIGGGTTDIAIISLGDLVYSRTLHLGGDALDTAVARMLKHKYQLDIGAQTAEWLKITVGHMQPHTPTQRLTIKGNDSVTGAPQARDVNADDVRIALLDPLETIIVSIQEAFETTPPELVADIIDTGLTLTGGGALLQGLVPYMRGALGLPVHLASNPMTCVALGAGCVLEKADLRQQVAMRL